MCVYVCLNVCVWGWVGAYKHVCVVGAGVCVNVCVL